MPRQPRSVDLVAVVAQEQLLERRRRGSSGCARRSRVERRSDVVEVVGVDVEARAAVLDLQVVHARQRRRARSAGRVVSTAIDVRVRWRSSASVPVSTVRPARMMRHAVAQRLDLGEDVAREQHGAALAAHLARCSRWKTASISGSRPDVGSSRISSSASEASAATSATFWRLPFEYARPFLRRVELEALEQLGAAAPGRGRRAAGRAGRSPRRR